MELKITIRENRDVLISVIDGCVLKISHPGQFGENSVHAVRKLCKRQFSGTWISILDCMTYRIPTQSEIYRRGNVENDWKSSVVRRSPSKAIIGFPIISDYLKCRKCLRFPDVGLRRKCQGFCALKSSEFRLKHALRNSLSIYFH